MAVKQALILAAGIAQRLMPLTENRPKGMLIVGGQPLLWHMVQALKANGIEDIVIVVGAHGEKIQSFFKDGADFGVKVRYVHQASPTGTLDAIDLAVPELDVTQGAIILPGHAFVRAETLRPVVGSKGTSLLVATAGDDHVQGIPAVRGDKLVGMRQEVPAVGSSRVTTNILHAGPELLKAVQEGALAGHKELDLALGDWASKGNSVRLVSWEGAWHVVVGPWDVLRLNEWILSSGLPEGATKFKGARGAVHVGENTVVAPTAILIGPTTIGEGCTIEDYCVIGPYVSIRNATVVAAHSEVRRSILNNNVLIESGAMLRGSIIDDGVQLGPRFLCAETPTPEGPRGCIIGRDSVLPARATLPGGSMLPAESRGGA